MGCAGDSRAHQYLHEVLPGPRTAKAEAFRGILQGILATGRCTHLHATPSPQRRRDESFEESPGRAVTDRSRRHARAKRLTGARRQPGTAPALRRRRRIRRRSRSEAPPHTPCSIRFTSAYSRHSSRTRHPWQMRCAASTPSPFEGKNSRVSAPRQCARSIHAYSSGIRCGEISSTYVLPFGPRGRVRGVLGPGRRPAGRGAREPTEIRDLP
jgi:hypothetical protein